MKKFLSTALVASTIAMAGGDVAPVTPIETPNVLNGFYIGGSYAYIDSTTDTFYGDKVENDENGFTLLGGYEFNNYVAVEGRYTWGAGSDFTYTDGAFSETLNGSDGTTTAWGVYVKPQYPVTEDAIIYALIGVAGVSMDSYDINVIDNETSFSWGLGAKYSVTNNVEVFADYTSLYDGDITDVYGDTFDGDVYAFNIGLTYKF